MNHETIGKNYKLTTAAMLSATAFILMFIQVPVPMLIPSFIKLDISDLPELIASFTLGPLYGVVVAFVKNVLFALLHGTSSAYIGELSNFLLGAVFSVTAGLVYHRQGNHKSRADALRGAVIGAVMMGVLCVPINFFVVYPAYTVCCGLPLDVIIEMYQVIRPSADGLLECLMVFNLPFTIFKGMIDAALCFLIYRPLTRIRAR